MATRWVVLTGLVLARIAFSFQFQSLAVVAPGIVDEFALDALAIGTLVGLYMIPGLFLAIPGGMLSQYVGERRYLIGCLALIVAGGVICGLANGYWSIWSGRLLSGIGAIGMNVVMAKIVIDWFQGKEIATAMSLFPDRIPRWYRDRPRHARALSPHPRDGLMLFRLRRCWVLSPWSRLRQAIGLLR